MYILRVDWAVEESCDRVINNFYFIIIKKYFSLNLMDFDMSKKI